MNNWDEAKLQLLAFQTEASTSLEELRNKHKKGKAVLREEMEALKTKIIVEMEPIIDLRATVVVGSLV